MCLYSNQYFTFMQGTYCCSYPGVCLTNADHYEFSLKAGGRFYWWSFCVDVCKFQQNIFCLLILFCLPVLTFAWLTALSSHKYNLASSSFWCIPLGIGSRREDRAWGRKSPVRECCQAVLPAPTGHGSSLLGATGICWGSSRTDTNFSHLSVCFNSDVFPCYPLVVCT